MNLLKDFKNFCWDIYKIFTTNKRNIQVFIILLYFLIGYACSVHTDFWTTMLIVFMIFLIDRCNYILGMSEGMVYATIHNKIFKKFKDLNYPDKKK